MLAVYLQVRGDFLDSGATDLPDDVLLPLTPGGMGMVTLLMSLVSRSPGRCGPCAATTAPTPTSPSGSPCSWASRSSTPPSTCTSSSACRSPPRPTGGLIYIVTGAHLVMVVVGLVFIAVMGFQSLGGQLTGRDAEGMTAAALYWYVTVAVYTAIYYGIYITK